MVGAFPMMPRGAPGVAMQNARVRAPAKEFARRSLKFIAACHWPVTLSATSQRPR
jgi:hypothetical protein